MLQDNIVDEYKGTSRGWVFTIHDYTEEQLRRGRVWIETHECIGMSAGLEIAPTTGSKHIQGYVRLDDSTKKGHFRKIIGPNAKGVKDWWMRKANADWAANAKYTSKDEKVVWHKVPPLSCQGARNDLVEFRDAVKRRAGDAELFESHLQVLAKYPRLEQRLKASFAKSRSVEFREVKRVVYFGPGGVGKSKRALYDAAGKRLPDTYIVPMGNNLKWWNDYEGEKTIVINEMQGDKCKFGRWKELMDGGQVQLETKGSHVYAEWTTVIMTTNVDPANWWANADINNNDFRRRLGKIYHWDDSVQGFVLQDV